MTSPESVISEIENVNFEPIFSFWTFFVFVLGFSIGGT